MSHTVPSAIPPVASVGTARTESGQPLSVSRIHAPDISPAQASRPEVQPWHRLVNYIGTRITRIGDKLGSSFSLHPQPASDPHWAKAHASYAAAKAKTRAEGVPRPETHRAVLKGLLGEIGQSVPFPNHIVHGNPVYKLAPEIIDVEPHEFQLAKLINNLQWIARLHLIKQGGSATKKPELFASRGATNRSVGFIRQAEPRWTGYAASVLQSGNCGENASLATMLAQSLDQETLHDMGIDLDLSKLAAHQIGEAVRDHAYVVMSHIGPSLQYVHRSVNGKPPMWQFSEQMDTDGLWSHDSHQLYPMVTRFNRSTYGNVKEANIYRWTRPGGPPEINLAWTQTVRRHMLDELGLGEDGIDKALRENFRVAKGVRSKFVDRMVSRQNVSHYAQVDKTQLSPEQRDKFERKVSKIERETDRKAVKHGYRLNGFEERWVGLCLPENPATIYRCRGSNELLAPTVPPHYLERTERIRWAHDAWKRLRPAQTALDRGILSKPVRFDIPPAVEAIEKMPFLGALAGARALNYRHNTLQAQMIGGYELAFGQLEHWVDRMASELASSPELISQIRTVGLQEEVVGSLRQVRDNLYEFSDLMGKLETDADSSSGAEQKARLGQLHWNILTSNSWSTVRSLLASFEDAPPSANARPPRPG